MAWMAVLGDERQVQGLSAGERDLEVGGAGISGGCRKVRVGGRYVDRQVQGWD
jgi:hypothetical protein